VDLAPRYDGRIRGPRRAIAFHLRQLANATLPLSRVVDCISQEIPLNFFVLPSPPLLAQSWISSNFNCQEHWRREQNEWKLRKNPNGVSLARLNDLWSVRKNPEEASLQTGWCNIVSFARILAGFRIFFPVSALSLSPSGFFALSAVFIRLYLSLRFTVIAYVNDRNEKIKKKDYSYAKKAYVYLSL